MKANSRYWYFRMKTGFFNTPEIQGMLDVPHYGDKLVLTLLRLYDYSTYNKGFIKIRKVDEEDTYIRYLSEALNLDFKFMAKAMKYYIEYGFIEIIENGVENTILEIPYIKDNTGRSSLESDRIRKIQAKNKESKLNGIPLIQEKSRGTLHVFGINTNVYLSKKEIERLHEEYKDASLYINSYSVQKKAKGVVIDNDFLELQGYIESQISNS